MRRLLYRKQVTKIKLSVAKSVVLALGLLIAFYPGYSKSAQVAPSNKPIELEVITLLGDQAKALPEFELIDHNKQILTNTRLSGKWNLMFFGYTSCPDICPTTLNDMNHVVNAIKDPEVLDALKVYFVSVDPQRDTTELLASYLSFFNPEFTGATANTEKLEVLTSALGVSYKILKKSEDDVNYPVSHSGFVVLIDPQVRYTGLYFSEPGNVQAVARDLIRLVNQAHQE